MLDSPCGSEHENPDARTIYIVAQGQYEGYRRTDAMETASEFGKHTLVEICLTPKQNAKSRNLFGWAETAKTEN
jgi:hypothetical protein